MTCDGEMNGVGNERGSPGSHARVQGYPIKGKPTLWYIMYRREKSWYMRCPDLDFSSLLYMNFCFYDFSLINCSGPKG